MELWVTFDVARGGVDLDRAEVTSDLNLAFGAQVLEVLVTEGNELALGDEEGEFIETLRGQLRDLDTGDDGADERGDLLDFDSILKQVWLLGVSAEARVGEFYMSSTSASEYIGKPALINIPRMGVGGNFSLASK